MMTRKDYIATAEIFNKYFNNSDASLENILNDFVNMFQNDNPNFNSKKFLEACVNG